MFNVIFKPRFLVKSEHWLHAAGIGFCCYVILPFGGAGSSMAGFGNNPVTATFFFILSYFFLYGSIYILIQTYGRYRLIRAIEKELGVKLKPAVYEAEEIIE